MLVYRMHKIEPHGITVGLREDDAGAGVARRWR
jgi:hypothetical protein